MLGAGGARVTMRVASDWLGFFWIYAVMMAIAVLAAPILWIVAGPIEVARHFRWTHGCCLVARPRR